MRWLALLFVTFLAEPAQADSEGCANATRLEHTFSSGASWALCADVDEQHALEITSLHYRAPGDSLRSVLKEIHVGQILMHYHDETDARTQIGADTIGRVLPMTARQCDGALLLDSGTGARLCTRVENNRVLAKFAQRPSLQSQNWELSSALQRGSLVWTVSVTLTEDGRVRPAVTLSGRPRETEITPDFASRLPGNQRQLARATVLTNWRMVFNLDSGAFDSVQQFDFVLNESLGNRRPMQITELDSEGFAAVERTGFRGWRIVDATGAGYYLDPFNSGFNYNAGQENWALFDVGLSRYNNCERYAMNNLTIDDQGESCGASLDDFVNGETLQNAHPVLWFSQSRPFNPSNEDWPVISNLHQSFTLLPFDWTQASPFEVIE